MSKVFFFKKNMLLFLVLRHTLASEPIKCKATRMKVLQELALIIKLNSLSEVQSIRNITVLA